MKIKSPIEITANALTYAIAFVDLEQVLKITSLICSIIISLTILIPKLIKWFKKATKDGKIDKEELEELTNIVEEETDKFKK